MSAPAQVRVSVGIKAALSSLLVTAGRPDHISTRWVRSFTHFDTLQTNAQACLKDRFWCLPVTRTGIERNKELTARGKKSTLLTRALKSNPLKLIPTFF